MGTGVDCVFALAFMSVFVFGPAMILGSVGGEIFDAAQLEQRGSYCPVVESRTCGYNQQFCEAIYDERWGTVPVT